MRFFYKTIGIVAFFCVSQSAFSAFPDDLYGFKLGDSTDATLNKLKNKYGKIEKLSGDEVSIKCGRGNIPKQDIYFYKNNTAYFYYDYYNTTFVLYDFSDDPKVGKITDDCINKTFQTNLP